MISERQEKLLNYLICEYINTAEPVSSFDLKKVARLDISAATIRNDLQELMEMGFIDQPHTSAGRVPTQKAYKYFAEKYEQEREKQFQNFISKQINLAHQEMAREMENMQKIMHALENDNIFEILNILDNWHKQK